MRENIDECCHKANANIHSVGINGQPISRTFEETVLRLSKAGHSEFAIADRTYVTRNVDMHSKPLRTERYLAWVDKVRSVIEGAARAR